MSSHRPSPPTLLIPDNSRSPAGNSPTNQTGRPPLWTRSAQRKMSRLYLYTTLPINKILDLIYADSPHAAPGYVDKHPSHVKFVSNALQEGLGQ